MTRTLSVLSAAILATMASPAAAAPSETAVLAGGCFWGMEGVFEHVKGVGNVVSGYAGGTKGFGGAKREGFAEAVRISFDPSQISYQQLLEIYFAVAHDPTQVNRQGPDVGPRYRSAIFPQSASQKQVAQQFLAAASRRFSKPVATRLESGGFDVAEPEHQDYLRRHPTARYVVVNDLPKLAKLRRDYPHYWRG